MRARADGWTRAGTSGVPEPALEPLSDLPGAARPRRSPTPRLQAEVPPVRMTGAQTAKPSGVSGLAAQKYILTAEGIYKNSASQRGVSENRPESAGAEPVSAALGKPGMTPSIKGPRDLCGPASWAGPIHGPGKKKTFASDLRTAAAPRRQKAQYFPCLKRAAGCC